MISGDNKRIMVTLPKELVTWLEQRAVKENRSMGNLIATVLQKEKGGSSNANRVSEVRQREHNPE
jgi:hypothetical protein